MAIDQPRIKFRYRRPGIRRRWRRILVGGAIIMAALTLGIVCRGYLNELSAPATEWQEVRAGSGITVDLPRDDGLHDNVAMEWWYYNGHLQTAAGQTYSFHFVTFVVDSVVKQLVSHLAFTNHQTGQHFTFQRRQSIGGAHVGREGFDFSAGDWRMAGYGGHDALTVSTPQFAFDLSLEPGPAPRFHGGTGLLDFQAAGSSYYYSRPRMPIQGKLRIGGKTEAVTGRAWFDHQWGDFRTDMLQWNWFALQFDDGSDVMLYQLSNPSGKPILTSGTYGKDDYSELLQGKDISAVPLGTWRSAATGTEYPLRWQIQLPRKHIDVTLNPVIDAAEIDARTSSYRVYWEGAVRLTGSLRGVGFLEVSRN